MRHLLATLPTRCLHSQGKPSPQSTRLTPNSCLPTPLQKNRNKLITSALPYINNTPHLGNLIGSCLSADAYARYCRLRGYNTLFVSGTDEYGASTQIKALKEKVQPEILCHKYHHLHKEIYQWFQISFDHFGRTTTQQHIDLSQQIFVELYQNGLITRKTEPQFRCEKCELFLPDRFVTGTCTYCQSDSARADQCESCSKLFSNPVTELSNPKCQVCGSKPISQQTEHYYFDLPKTSAKLKEWLYGEKVIESWAKNAQGMTNSWLRDDQLRARCITRDLKWGVPVPLGESQAKVLYVWFEAPLGYISITKQFLGEGYEKWWVKQEGVDVDLHQFMGKDNIIFHSLLSPAALLHANKPWVLPTKLEVTDYLQYQGKKFSKSRGIGVFGDECKSTNIESDVWRFYLLSNRPENYDTEFSWPEFMECNNKDLLNNIGNLFNRVVKSSYKLFGPTIPCVKAQNMSEAERQLLIMAEKEWRKYVECMEKCRLKQGAQSILELSHKLNKYIQDTQFWKQESKRQSVIIGTALRMFAVLSLIIQPYLPSTSARINYTLGLSNEMQHGAFQPLLKQFDQTVLSSLKASSGLKQPEILFRKISEQQCAQMSAKFGG